MAAGQTIDANIHNRVSVDACRVLADDTSQLRNWILGARGIWHESVGFKAGVPSSRTEASRTSSADRSSGDSKSRSKSAAAAVRSRADEESRADLKVGVCVRSRALVAYQMT